MSFRNYDKKYKGFGFEHATEGQSTTKETQKRKEDLHL